jgi:hypothetical protein
MAECLDQLIVDMFGSIGGLAKEAAKLSVVWAHHVDMLERL